MSFYFNALLIFNLIISTALFTPYFGEDEHLYQSLNISNRDNTCLYTKALSRDSLLLLFGVSSSERALSRQYGIGSCIRYGLIFSSLISYIISKHDWKIRKLALIPTLTGGELLLG